MRILRWLRDLSALLSLDALWAPLAILVPLVVAWTFVASGLFDGPPSDRVRWASGTLQIAGAMVVVLALVGRRRLLKETPFVTSFLNWLSRIAAHFRKQRASSVTLSGSGGAFDIVGGSGRMWVQHRDTEKRLDAIESELASLHQRIDRQSSDLGGRIDALDTSIQSRLRSARDELTKLDTRVRGLAVGSAHWELMGLFWFLAGLLLATFPTIAAPLIARAT